MQVLRTGRPVWGVVMGVYTPDGRLSCLNINGAPIFAEGSETPSASVTTFTDIFRQVQAERVLRERLVAIFDLFEQANTTTARRFGSTGLGLAISRHLCELMGYYLNVQSVVGQGSR